MSESAFDDYLTQWRDASPQRAIAWRFLCPAERNRFGATAALVQEWRKAVREVRESQVAAVKLGWWREEMQRAGQGEARHPLTQALFVDLRVQSIPLPYWTAPVDAAIGMLALPLPANVAAQWDAAAPFADAVAALETRVWFGEGADPARMAQVVLLAGAVSVARALPTEVEHGRSPVPMNLLARHGLTIEALGRDGAERRAALRDYVGELERIAVDAARMQGPLTLFRAVDLQRDRQAIERATRAEDPLAALHAPAHGVGSVLKIWRAARKWRGMVRNESHA
jgi:phytoene synthase